MSAAIRNLPAQTAQLVWQRMEEARTAARPIVCPMLEQESGTCLVYEARPMACRAYGFYVERDKVLGCARIESIGARAEPDVIWGNHAALEESLQAVAGEPLELHRWTEDVSDR